MPNLTGEERLDSYNGLTGETPGHGYVSRNLTTFKRVGWIMVFNATFNSISVISRHSVLLVDETEVPGENRRPVASH